MIQNLGSNPNINCKIITEEVMMIGFLYLKMNSFIDQQHLEPGVQHD